MDGNNAMYGASANQWAMSQMPPPMPPQDGGEGGDMEEGDNAHRPPNAFILYSQAMRSQVRQENPSLSNTEVSRLLGKMWKEVPNDIKLQYKQKAAAMQEEFKREHPDYTYRKARRKRALNELLTKSSTQGFQPFPMTAQFPGDMSSFPAGQQPYPMGFPAAGQQSSDPNQHPMGFPMSGMQSMPGAMGNIQGMPPMTMAGMSQLGQGPLFQLGQFQPQK